MKRNYYLVLIYRIMIILFALFGTLITQINNGFFNVTKYIYFTYQSNLLVAFFYIWLVIKGLKNKTEITSIKNKLFFLIVTFNITVTFLVFFLFLTSYQTNLTGNALIRLKTGSTLLHFVVPLMVNLDYYLNAKNTTNHYRNFLFNLIYPIGYFIFIILRAQFGPPLNLPPFSTDSYYPYPFLDIDKLGLLQVSINCAILLILFILLSLSMTFIDKKINKTYSNYITKLLREERRAKQERGWSFAYIEKRVSIPALPWNYQQIIIDNLKNDDMLLDIGTGDGEFAMSLKHDPSKIIVTEGYLPNYRLCQKKLFPLGIKVLMVNNVNALPFPNNYFDIVINRYDEYNLLEIARILKTGGLFITEQVGSQDTNDLILILTKPDKIKKEEFSLNSEITKIDLNIWEIINKNEDISDMYFFDIEALVYFVSRIPWQFPQFKVREKIAELEVLNTICKKQGYISTLQHRFFFMLKKK